MNLSTKHWKAVLGSLALTVAMPAMAQESTGDPFLDAVLQDQAKAKQEQQGGGGLRVVPAAPGARGESPAAPARPAASSMPLPGGDEAQRELVP